MTLYGVNNANMQLVRNLFPKLRIAARGSVIKVIGEDAETAQFEKTIRHPVSESFCGGESVYRQRADDKVPYGEQKENERNGCKADEGFGFGR